MVVEPAGLTRAGDCSGEIRMQDNKTARSPHHPWLQSAPKNDRKSIVVQIAVPRKFAGRNHICVAEGFGCPLLVYNSCCGLLPLAFLCRAGGARRNDLRRLR